MGWTGKELELLRNAQRSVEPTDVSCWEKVARRVGTKSAVECSARWFSDVEKVNPSSSSSSSRRTRSKAKAKERAEKAVSDAAKAISVAQDTEEADRAELRKARLKLKRAFKGLEKIETKKQRHVDLFHVIHNSPQRRGGAMERALRSAAAVELPCGSERARTTLASSDDDDDDDEETPVHQSYLASLRKCTMNSSRNCSSRTSAAARQQASTGRQNSAASSNTTAAARKGRVRQMERDGGATAVMRKDGTISFSGLPPEEEDDEEGNILA